MKIIFYKLGIRKYCFVTLFLFYHFPEKHQAEKFALFLQDGEQGYNNNKSI